MTNHIWITRTEPGASRLAKKLLELGYKVFTAPVYEIEEVKSSAPPKDTNLWVFVSAHAACLSADRQWNKSLPAIAVGPTTAAQLISIGIHPLVPDEHSSEGVFNLIRNRFNHGLSVTIVTGREGRKDLGSWLNSEGYCCNEWIVYERKPTDVRIGNTRLDAIIIASMDALSKVRQQFDSKACVSIPLVVPSPRYVGLATSMQFSTVLIADGASDIAVINALQDFFTE